MKPWLLLLLLCVPSYARKNRPMTPALKGRLAEIAASKKAELKPSRSARLFAKSPTPASPSSLRSTAR